MSKIHVQLPPRTPISKFDEAEFIRLVFRARKLQNNLYVYSRKIMQLLPVEEKVKIFPASYMLSAYNFAHIIERHYSTSKRNASTSRFTIPLPEVFEFIRMGFLQPPSSRMGIVAYVREFKTDRIVGITREGVPTNCMIIATDAEGRIKSAYPVSSK